MKRLDSLKKLIKSYEKNKILTKEDSILIIKMQAALKEHILEGICTYCARDVDINGFKNLSQTHDYHLNGMCLNCLDELKKESNKDLKWLN